MVAVFDAQRAVEIFGPAAYGSGYRVTSTLILTACHLLGQQHDATVRVRDLRGRAGAARVAWADGGHDLALLELEPSGEEGLSVAEAVPPASLGRLSRSPGVSWPFEMLGWPRAGAVANDAGGWVRDPVHVAGEIRSAELIGSQSHLVRLRPADRYPALADGSWWSGMSGAAVFCGGLLIGVQVRQNRPELPDLLAAQLIEGDGLDELIGLLAAAGVSQEVALDPDAVAVDEYLNRLDRRLDTLPAWFPARLRADGALASQLFQQPELRTAPGARSGIVELAADKTVTVVEGEAGAGKTWLVSAYARALTVTARAHLRGGTPSTPIRLPMFCRLSELNEHAGQSGLVDAASEFVAFSPLRLRDAVRRLAARQPVRVHLVVDGVDEASEAQKRSLVRAVDDFLAGALADVDAVVLATRRGEFRPPEDSRVALLRLHPFTTQQQRRLVAAWFAGSMPEAEGRVLALAGHWRVNQAFRNPLLLTLTCVAAEQWGNELGPLRNVGDIYHASVIMLIDSAHRDGVLRSQGTVAQRRARRETVRTLMDLAARLFRTGGFRPYLDEDEILDLPGEILDACLKTGLVTLRADGGVDFANRTLATYLAAQHHATTRTWRAVLESVWEDESIGEIAALIPHALTRPMLGDVEPGLVESWFADAETQMEAGDPGFLLLHVATRALSLLESLAAPADRVPAYVRTLRAHLHARIDPNAAESLATLAPGALEDLARDLDPYSAAIIGLLLASVGYDQGYLLLHSRIEDWAEQELSEVIGVLCWVAKRGDSRGMAMLEELAGTGSAAVRRFAALLLALTDSGDASMRRLADALDATRDVTAFPDHLRLALGLLHEHGDAAATQRLVELWHEDKSQPEPTLYRWLGNRLTDAVERLKALLDGWPPRAIAAAVCLVDIDRELGIEVLDRLSQPKEFDGSNPAEDVSGAVIAAYQLAHVDRDRGLRRLAALTDDPRFVAVQAAAAYRELDEERGTDLLIRLATSNDEIEYRIAAARLLQSYGHPAGDRLFASIVDSGDERARAKSQALTESHVVIAATRQIAEANAKIKSMQLSPREALLELVGQVPDELPPAEALPPDPDEMVGFYGVIDSGLTPYLNRLDLGQPLDQRALALAIPVYDGPVDRNFLVASAIARAPHSHELQRYLGSWASGGLEDSPIWIFSNDENRPEVAKWAEAIARASEAMEIAEWVIRLIWGDPVKVTYRCLALAFRHPTSVMLLEIAHRFESPTGADTGLAINGIRPMPGLSEPTTRACVGKACLLTVVDALVDAEVDADTDDIRTRYAARLTALFCRHGWRPPKAPDFQEQR